MVFTRYFLGRYITYFSVLTIVLSILFNIVEFIEKSVRVSSVSALEIAYFSYLNFFAAFIYYAPAAAWLACCLVLRELVMQCEWDVLKLLGVGYNGLFKALLISSLLTMITMFVADEFCFNAFSRKAEQYRLVTFKNKRTDCVVNAWYKFDDTTFCYINSIDFKTLKGKDLHLINMNRDFSLKEISIVDNFTCDPKSYSISVDKGIKTSMNGVVNQQILNNTLIKLPKLFGNIHLHQQSFSVLNFVKNYLYLRSLLLLSVNEHLWNMFWEKVFFYLQLVLLPILSLIFFILCEKFNRVRWLAMLLPFPLYTIITLLLGLFLHENNYFYGMLLVYMVFTGGMMLFYRHYLN